MGNQRAKAAYPLIIGGDNLRLIDMGILTQKSFDDCQHRGAAVKIREYHYELTKDMTTQERINFYNEGGRAFLKEMEERKLQKV